jgi:hypothetical protein
VLNTPERSFITCYSELHNMKYNTAYTSHTVSESIPSRLTKSINNNKGWVMEIHVPKSLYSSKLFLFGFTPWRLHLKQKDFKERVNFYKCKTVRTVNCLVVRYFVLTKVTVIVILKSLAIILKWMMFKREG